MTPDPASVPERIQASIDIASADIADVFAHLLEVEGHAALNPDATTEYGYGFYPNWGCGVFRKGGFHRSLCPSCVALRKFYLDKGLTEEEIAARWRLYNNK